MQKTLKRTELEQQLQGKSESISRRLEAIQQEVGDISLRRVFLRKPWIGLAAVTVGGLLVGLLFGRRGSRRGSRNVQSNAFVDGYAASVSDDVRRLTAKGRDLSEAIAESLRNRLPVVAYPVDEDHSERGFFGRTAGLVFKAAAGFAAKAALDYATQRIDIERRMNDFMPGGDGSDPGVDSDVAQNQQAP